MAGILVGTKEGSCLADEEVRQGWRAMVIIR